MNTLILLTIVCGVFASNVHARIMLTGSRPNEFMPIFQGGQLPASMPQHFQQQQQPQQQIPMPARRDIVEMMPQQNKQQIQQQQIQQQQLTQQVQQLERMNQLTPTTVWPSPPPVGRAFPQQQQQPQGRIVPVPSRQPLTRESFCANRKPEEIIVHPANPSQFIVCHKDGDFDIMSCPAGLVFNTDNLRCDVRIAGSQRGLRGCAANPCKNNAPCTDLPQGMHRCDCPVGFIGANCERDDHCSASSCGPDGICVPLGNGSPVNHYCICSNGQTFGMSCGSNVEPNPCKGQQQNDVSLFPINTNPSIFVHCDGLLPNLKFCPWPLQFSMSNQECVWKTS